MSEFTNNNDIIVNETENASAGDVSVMAYAPITANPASLSFGRGAASKEVTVSCTDTTWTVGGGSSWCTITKVSNTKVRVSVTANSGTKRNISVVCHNGTKVASIFVEQEGEVIYDRSGMIIVYKQITNNSCATTCAGMCVKKSPQTLKDAGFNLDWADWDGIAKKYGYTTEGVKIGSISDVFNVLKSGYPAISYINDGSNGKLQHWVVVTKYKGDGLNMSASNFTCADPATGTTVALDKATNFNKITKYVVFK